MPATLVTQDFYRSRLKSFKPRVIIDRRKLSTNESVDTRNSRI